MSTTKLIDNNRRTHAAKVLAQTSKKSQEQNVKTGSDDENITETTAFNQDMSEKDTNQILEQYRIIREDVLKLREDLSEGYDLLKQWIDSKISVRNLLRLNR
jgi:hypothetical protein